MRDLTAALRTLRRAPALTLVIVVSLALATGATAAIVAVVYGVLLRPLPFVDPDRLVEVHGRVWRQDRGAASDPINGPIGFPELEAYRTRSTQFEGFVSYSTSTTILDGSGDPERLTAFVADAALFSLLGAVPLAGRTFQPGDPVDMVVISAGLWERRWGRDPALPGRTITLDGQPVVVLGVMPDDFQFPYRAAASLLPGALPESRTDIWRPDRNQSRPAAQRQGRTDVVARLKPGVTVAAARGDLQAIAAQLTAVAADPRTRIEAEIVPLADAVIGPVRGSLWILFGAVALVLIAACANVANLLLAQMTSRLRDVVTRAALGATRAHLVRQFLLESLLLSAAGGVLGVLVARWTLHALVSFGSTHMPRSHEIAVDWTVFAALFGICSAAAAMFGLAPAIAAARVDPAVAMREGGYSTIGGRFGRARDLLVIAEVALACTLVFGALLVLREVARLERTPAGMATENVLTMHLTPRLTAQEYEAIASRVAAVPGVLAAGFTQLLPLQNWGWQADFRIVGRPPDERRRAELRYVTTGYFDAMGIPLLRGRRFTAGDAAGAPPVILVNDALARQYFPSDDALGRETDRGTIVGIVGGVRQVALGQPAVPEIYYAVAQNVTMAPDIGMTLVARTSSAPDALAPAVRGALRESHPHVAVFHVRTMNEVVRESLTEVRFFRWALGLFALLVFGLAAIGLAGLMSFHAAVRTREFALRLALGAAPVSLVGMVVASGARLVALGAIAGGLIVLLAAPLARRLPGGQESGAYGLYALAIALICVLAIVASMGPAMRVWRLDPARALRQE